MLERVWRNRNSFTVGRNVNWYNSYRKSAWRFLRKLKIELSYSPTIPFLGIYLDKTIIQKATCTPMFIAALFTNSHNMETI